MAQPKAARKCSAIKKGPLEGGPYATTLKVIPRSDAAVTRSGPRSRCPYVVRLHLTNRFREDGLQCSGVTCVVSFGVAFHTHRQRATLADIDDKFDRRHVRGPREVDGPLRSHHLNIPSLFARSRNDSIDADRAQLGRTRRYKCRERRLHWLRWGQLPSCEGGRGEERCDQQCDQQRDMATEMHENLLAGPPRIPSWKARMR